MHYVRAPSSPAEMECYRHSITLFVYPDNHTTLDPYGENPTEGAETVGDLLHGLLSTYIKTGNADHEAGNQPQHGLSALKAKVAQ